MKLVPYSLLDISVAHSQSRPITQCYFDSNCQWSTRGILWLMKDYEHGSVRAWTNDTDVLLLLEHIWWLVCRTACLLTNYMTLSFNWVVTRVLIFAVIGCIRYSWILWEPVHSDLLILYSFLNYHSLFHCLSILVPLFIKWSEKSVFSSSFRNWMIHVASIYYFFSFESV